jgi:Protein of unknown function (DUF1629)
MMHKPGRARIRRFYTISWSYFHGKADFEVENLDVLLKTFRDLFPTCEYGIGAMYPPPGQRGFLDYPEKPRVVIGRKRKGPPPSDIELYHSYWLVSDRLKRLFESIDPAAVAFQACDVFLRDGSIGPPYWLCDVVRVVEVFDEATVQEIRSHFFRFSWLRHKRCLVFNTTAIGKAHMFRTPSVNGKVFCDQTMKDACKAAGMKGVMFQDCTPKRGAVAKR